MSDDDGPLTVMRLLKLLARVAVQGMGDRVVAVTDDEEGNGYHLLWFDPETDPQMIAKVLEDTPADIGDLTAEEVILLG